VNVESRRYVPRPAQVRLVVAMCCTAGLGLSLVSCSSSSSSSSAATSTGVVNIAVEGPISGAQQSTGQDMVRGAELAVDQLNSKGGVLGRSLAVIPADDKASPSVGVSVAHSMVDRHVTAVVGPFNSSVGVDNLHIYKQAGVAILRLTSSSSTEGYGITTQPMDTQVAPVEEAELVQVLHASSVAILYDPSTYTSSIASQLKTLLTAASVSVPLFKSTPPGTNPQTAVSEVESAKPEVVYLAMYGPEAGPMVSALVSGYPQGRCFVDLAAQGSTFVQGAGAQAASHCVSSGVPSASQLPSGLGYENAYVNKFHQEPGTWGSFTYDSVMMLASAARSAKTWNEPALSQSLDHTSGFTGVTGTITIEPKSGNRVSPPVVILDVTSAGAYEIDPTWAAFAHYPLPPAGS
jgi:branched-chain amino acid transport system substrate-binding protein